MGIKLNLQTRTGTSQGRTGDKRLDHPSLSYRAGVTATLACFRGNVAVLEAIAMETKMEGKSRKWIERLGLMDGPLPHSTSRSLYIIWDTVDALAHPMLSIEERLSTRNGDAQGEGDCWTAWKETMGDTSLSPPLSRESSEDRGGEDNHRDQRGPLGGLETRERPEPIKLAQLGQWHL